MGGYIAIRYALQKGESLEFDGVVAIAPAINKAFPINPIKYWSGIWASHILPSFTVENDLDFTMLSRIEAVVASYEKDALIHSKISLQTGIL